MNANDGEPLGAPRGPRGNNMNPLPRDLAESISRQVEGDDGATSVPPIRTQTKPAVTRNSISEPTKRKFDQDTLESERIRMANSLQSDGNDSAAGVGGGEESIDPSNKGGVSQDEDLLLNGSESKVDDLLSSGASVIAANPQNEEVKNLIIELELETMKTALTRLKGQKSITPEEYDEFIKNLEAKGFELRGMGPEEIEQNGFLGLRKKNVPNSLEAKLKNAEVKINASKQKQIRDALMGRNNIGEKVALRDYVISRTGRENGPDIALKVIPRITDTEFESIKNIIHENSSITEVMNILAFLLNNKTDRGTSIVTEFSIEYGEHDKNGKYTDASKIGKSGDINTVYNSLNNGPEPYNIKTLTQNKPSSSTVGELPAGGIILPEGIIKRDASSYDTQDPITITYEQVPLVISACTLQMINLLENTRQVFGGWAKLFKGMQGGSTKSKTKTKKTRRRYRRKY